MKESGKMENFMDKELYLFLMGESMKESGKGEKSGMENYMVKTEKSFESL